MFNVINSIAAYQGKYKNSAQYLVLFRGSVSAQLTFAGSIGGLDEALGVGCVCVLKYFP